MKIHKNSALIRMLIHTHIAHGDKVSGIVKIKILKLPFHTNSNSNKFLQIFLYFHSQSEEGGVKIASSSTLPLITYNFSIIKCSMLCTNTISILFICVSRVWEKRHSISSAYRGWMTWGVELNRIRKEEKKLKK
jgi:hypothetical protein